MKIYIIDVYMSGFKSSESGAPRSERGVEKKMYLSCL